MKGFLEDTARLVKSVVHGHIAAFSLWLAFEAGILLLFHKWYRVDAYDNLMSGSRFWLEGEYYILMGLFAVAQAWLSTLLGWIFNMKRPTSWLRSLPASEAASLTAPIVMILANACVLAAAMADLWFLHAILNGNSVFLFLCVLPLVVFILVRSLKHLPAGSLLAGVTAGSLFWAYNTSFVYWQMANSVLAGELYFVAFLGLCFLAFERRQWRVGLATTVLVALLPILLAFSPYVVAPSSFRGTVVSLRYFQTAPAAERFRDYVARPDGWKAIEAFAYVQSTPDIGRGATAAANKVLSDEDGVLLARLVQDHPEIFEITRSRGEKTSFYPAPRMSKALAQWTAAQWNDTPYMCTLAKEAFDQHGFPLETLLRSNCGRGLLLSHGIWLKYKPWKAEPLEAELDRLIVDARAKLPPLTRDTLYQRMLQMSSYAKDRQEQQRLEEKWMEAGVNEDELEAWKRAFLAPERAVIRANATSKPHFVQWVSTLSAKYNPEDGFDRTMVLRLVCEQVADRCTDAYFDLTTMNPLVLLAHKLHTGFVSWERTVVWYLKRRIVESTRLDDMQALASM